MSQQEPEHRTVTDVDLGKFAPLGTNDAHEAIADLPQTGVMFQHRVDDGPRMHAATIGPNTRHWSTAVGILRAGSVHPDGSNR